VRVPQLDELLSHVIIDVEDSVGVTLDDSLFGDCSVAQLVFGTASTHKGLKLVQFAHTAL